MPVALPLAAATLTAGKRQDPWRIGPGDALYSYLTSIGWARRLRTATYQMLRTSSRPQAFGVTWERKTKGA